MRFLSLFSGIGAQDLGLEWAGWECVGQCEIEPFPRAVLQKHWPYVPKWEDVCELDAVDALERCGRIDAIVGGFPCQPQSVAGKRLGQADDRHLWPEYARLVREIRPRWVLAENVPGLLLSMHNNCVRNNHLDLIAKKVVIPASAFVQSQVTGASVILDAGFGTGAAQLLELGTSAHGDIRLEAVNDDVNYLWVRDRFRQPAPLAGSVSVDF